MPPETLLTTLRESLLACAPVGSNASLKDLFAVPRLAPWRDQIPEARTRAARVDALIAAIGHSRRNDGKAALILLLEVLAERTDPTDACRERLLSLVSQYAAIAHAGGNVVVAGPLPDRPFAGCLEGHLAPYAPCTAATAPARRRCPTCFAS